MRVSSSATGTRHPASARLRGAIASAARPKRNASPARARRASILAIIRSQGFLEGVFRVGGMAQLHMCGVTPLTDLSTEILADCFNMQKIVFLSSLFVGGR
ncbi:hypothetical protein DR64_5363 [Paraburkholderia xenovorans LB400]|nr:hypothetical protein DR64_5363 [Paraburkholderia xenovorans LB400]